MASQYGTKRIMSNAQVEDNNAGQVQCPLCNVIVLPRGLCSTRATETMPGTHCPSCGHVFSPSRPISPAE